MLASVFEPFQQARPTDATELGGSGVGLTVCKMLVEMHNGHITVESVEGKGSTFAFTLPYTGATRESEMGLTS
jgi:signal transduction histidine kinase